MVWPSTRPNFEKQRILIGIVHDWFNIIPRKQAGYSIANSFIPAVIVLLYHINDCTLHKRQLIIFVLCIVIYSNDCGSNREKVSIVLIAPLSTIIFWKDLFAILIYCTEFTQFSCSTSSPESDICLFLQSWLPVSSGWWLHWMLLNLLVWASASGWSAVQQWTWPHKSWVTNQVGLWMWRSDMWIHNSHVNFCSDCLEGIQIPAYLD